MAISFLTDLIGFGLGLVLGGTGIWLILAGRFNTTHERARKESQDELTALQERLRETGRDLADYRARLDELQASAATTRRELEDARASLAGSTARAEQIANQSVALYSEKSQLLEKIDSLNSTLTIVQSELAKTGNDRDNYSKLVSSLDRKLMEQESEINNLRAEVQSLGFSNSQLQAEIETERKHANEKLMLLAQAKDELRTQFEVVAAKILDEKSRRFTELNASNLSFILDPIKTKLDEFKGKVEESYHEESKQRFSLEQEVRRLVSMTNQLDAEAKSLTQALKGDSKARGIWGEFILKRVLEKSGLNEGREYRSQLSLQTEDGKRQQPDIIVDLPQGRNVVIDSKVSLIAYQQLASEDNPVERERLLAEHIKSIQKHIKELNLKQYQELYQINSLDFVLMFIPVEPAFNAAYQADPECFTQAFEKNVIVVTPNTLLVTLRTIAFTWKQEYRTRNYQEITEQGKALYNKFASFAESILAVGQRIDQTQVAYETAMKQFKSGKGNLIRQAEKLRDLGIPSSKSIPQAMLEEADAAEEEEDLQASDG